MTFREDVTAKEKAKFRTVWISLLMITFMKNYLNLFLRTNEWTWADLKSHLELIPSIKNNLQQLQALKKPLSKMGLFRRLFKETRYEV
jgi:hypothetical protein